MIAAPHSLAAYTLVTSEKGAGGEVRDPQGELVCVTVHTRYAVEVARRLAA